MADVYQQFAERGLVSWKVAQALQAVKAPPVAKNTTPALTREQAVALLEAIPRHTLQGLRDLALIRTFFITGCRVSAVLGAQVGNLEFDGVEHYLHVTEKRGKRIRKILLDAARPILRYMAEAGIQDDADGPLFRPMPADGAEFERRFMNRKAPWRLVKRYCRAAGISPDRLGGRGIGVHSLRKTPITMPSETELGCTKYVNSLDMLTFVPLNSITFAEKKTPSRRQGEFAFAQPSDPSSKTPN